VRGVGRWVAFVVRFHQSSLPRGPQAVQIGDRFNGLR
jgi:hypothetical protein